MSKNVSPTAVDSVPADMLSTSKPRPKMIGLGVLAIVLLVVLINALAGNVLRSARIDLTQEKLYSLSPAVGPFLKGLDEPIDIQLFISRDALTNLPVYRAYATRVEEFLSEMQRVSDGKINLTVLNPEPFSEAEDLARTMGLQQGNTGRAGENLVLGVVLTNTVDHREVLPFLSPAEEPTLEYDLMRAISGLAKPKKPLLGLITALPMAGSPPRPGKNDPGKPPYAAGAQMEKLFRVLQIDRLADKLPEGLDALVMVHPAGLSDNLLRGIDTYVHQGGRVALFFDPQHESNPKPGPKQVRLPVASDLGDLMQAWGVEVDIDEIVADPSYAQRIRTEGAGASGAPMLSWLGLSPEAMSGDTPITRSLQFLVFASAGHIQRLDSAPESLVITPLIESSTEAGLVDSITTGQYGKPADIMREHQPSGESYVMAARITGPVRRAYPDLPDDPDAVALDDAEAVQDLPLGDKDADIVLVADADVMADRFWVQQGYAGPQPVADNGAFLLSALEVLTGNPVLSGLRPRAASRRPFTLIEELQREAEDEFLSEVERLQNEVRSTEARLAHLLQQNPADSQTLILELDDEQQAEIQALQDQTLEGRKALRGVQYELSRNIDRLGQRLMLINVAAWPALIAMVLAVGLAWRWKRSRILD